MLNKKIILRFIEQATAEMSGSSGQCGLFAVALNRVLFDGKGKIFASESYAESGFLDHVAVKYKNSFYDETGEIKKADLLSYCFQDENNEDEFNPEIAEESAIIHTNCNADELSNYVKIMTRIKSEIF